MKTKKLHKKQGGMRERKRERESRERREINVYVREYTVNYEYENNGKHHHT
jgi:hypothetical protein